MITSSGALDRVRRAEHMTSWQHITARSSFCREKRSRGKKAAGAFKESESSIGSYLPTAEGFTAIDAALCLQHCHVLVDQASVGKNSLVGV